MFIGLLEGKEETYYGIRLDVFQKTKQNHPCRIHSASTMGVSKTNSTSRVRTSTAASSSRSISRRWCRAQAPVLVSRGRTHQRERTHQRGRTRSRGRICPKGTTKSNLSILVQRRKTTMGPATKKDEPRGAKTNPTPASKDVKPKKEEAKAAPRPAKSDQKIEGAKKEPQQ